MLTNIVVVLRQKGHRNGSGAKLAEALGIRHYHKDSRPKRLPRPLFVINWGVSVYPAWVEFNNGIISNSYRGVATCVNKLRALVTLAGAKIPCLEFTQDRDQFIDWVYKDGKAVARHSLTGHSGQGIEIWRPDLLEMHEPMCDLYTRYFKKDAEYRVHVAFGKVILVQQKKRKNGYENLNLTNDQKLIRTNGNGWVFAINDLDCDRLEYSEKLKDLALSAARAVDIEHGAVDILVKHSKNGATMVVCEINTAPALNNPSTLEAYVKAFEEYFDEEVA